VVLNRVWKCRLSHPIIKAMEQSFRPVCPNSKAAWRDAHGIAGLASLEAFHVTAFRKDLQGQVAPPP
jgi:hypothetical protein